MGRRAPPTDLRVRVAALRAALRIHRKGPTRAQQRLCASGAKSIAPSSPLCLIGPNMQPGIDLPSPSGAKQGHDVFLRGL